MPLPGATADRRGRRVTVRLERARIGMPCTSLCEVWRGSLRRAFGQRTGAAKPVRSLPHRGHTGCSRHSGFCINVCENAARTRRSLCLSSQPGFNPLPRQFVGRDASPTAQPVELAPGVCRQANPYHGPFPLKESPNRLRIVVRCEYGRLAGIQLVKGGNLSHVSDICILSLGVSCKPALFHGLTSD